ncbi:hypothetical protein ACFC1L_39900 [Streptomyces sp. NPDC056210]|uniref:hypothetical protein n=1 Tax=Streptomyces sp. NPDC056210 TaxID=3345746 RepID=UPI0035DEA2FC
MIENYEDAQKYLKLTERARKAVKNRKYTDKPGSEWRLGETIGSIEGSPQYVGLHGKAVIYPSDCATRYEVHTFDFGGRRLHQTVGRKTLDSAFRVGEKLSSTKGDA